MNRNQRHQEMVLSKTKQSKLDRQKSHPKDFGFDRNEWEPKTTNEHEQQEMVLSKTNQLKLEGACSCPITTCHTAGHSGGNQIQKIILDLTEMNGNQRQQMNMSNKKWFSQKPTS